jgi:purine nucleoside permease
MLHRHALARCLLLALGILAASNLVSQTPAHTNAASSPWPIRVVVVTPMPSEFERWSEREHLSETVDLPGNVQPLRTNADHTVLGLISGGSLPNAAGSIMVLGLDPRFDLTHAYWIINGTAGVDPEDASIGSAAWANYVVGDTMREVDPREAPADWPYGHFAAGGPVTTPSAAPVPVRPGSNSYALNPSLVAWAYQKTKDLKLQDDPEAATFRAAYTGYPNAQRPPFVLIGDDYASDHYWHGKILTQFARDWVKSLTGGNGTFVMTEMEDSGFLNSLFRLDAVHRIDLNRVLVLRGASNYSMQPPGVTAVASLTTRFPVGSKLSNEATWACGSAVLHSLVDNWDKYYEHVPAP